MEDKDLIMGYAKVLKIETYLYMRARQTIVSKRWLAILLCTVRYGYVCTVYTDTYKKYMIGESQDVSDRPLSTPAQWVLILSQ